MTHMTSTPNITLEIRAEFQKSMRQVTRHLNGTRIAVELAGAVTAEQIDLHLEKFRADEGHAKSESDLRWIREVTPDWERMVTDGIAWLVAAQEYTTALEVAQTETTTED